MSTCTSVRSETIFNFFDRLSCQIFTLCTLLIPVIHQCTDLIVTHGILSFCRHFSCSHHHFWKFIYVLFFPSLYCRYPRVGTVVYIHNHFMSAEWTPPWRYGLTSHHSHTVSSSRWLAGMPEDTRQQDEGAGRCSLHENTGSHFFCVAFHELV